MKTPTIKWAQNDNFIFIDILIEPSSDCIINIKNNCLNFKQNDYECELELYDLILENDSKIKKTIGKQNADFQITRFNNNAQPFYVVLDPFSEKIIYSPWGYELNIEKYISHLKNGLKEYYNE